MDRKIGKKQKKFLECVTKPDPEQLKTVISDKKVDVNFIYNHRYSVEGDCSDFNAYQIACLEHDLILEENNGQIDPDRAKSFETCVRILLEHGIDVKYVDPLFQERAIDQAAQSGNIPILKTTINHFRAKNILLENSPVVINFLNFLYFNLEIRQDLTEDLIVEIVKVLLENNIDVNLQDEYGETIVYLLAEMKQNEDFKDNKIADKILSTLIDVRGTEIDLHSDNKKFGKIIKELCSEKVPKKLQKLFKLLRDKDPSGFKTEYGENFGDIINEEINEAEFFCLLRQSVQRSCGEIVDYLLELDNAKKFTDYAEKNNMHLVLVEKACIFGHSDILAKLLDSFDKLNNDVLMDIAWDLVKVPFNADKNHDVCLQKLLACITEPNISKTDVYGKPMLYYAVKNKQVKMCAELLKHGATLIYPTMTDAPVLSIDMEMLKNHLNDCIEQQEEMPSTRKQSGVRKDKKFMRLKGEYHINVSSLLPDYETIPAESNEAVSDAVSMAISVQTEVGQSQEGSIQEMALLEYISENPDYSGLLRHPVIRVLLKLKWHKIRHFFYLELLIYFVFTVLLFGYLMVSTSQIVSVKGPLFYLVVALFHFVLLWEIFQMVMFQLEYFRFFENWMNLVLLICTFSIIILDFTDKNLTVAKKDIYAVTSIVLFMNIFYMSVNFPQLTTNVIMLRTVYYTLFKFLLNYIPVLLAFASGFYILFHRHQEKPSEPALKEEKTDYFSNFGLSFFKTFMMLTGEFEIDDVPLDLSPIVSHLMFLLFIILIAVGMLNLLTGLAVSDIQMIRSEAILYNKKLRIEQVAKLEKIWLNNRIVTGVPFLHRRMQKVFLLCTSGEKKTLIIVNPVTKTVRVKNDGESDEIRNIINDSLLMDIENKDKFTLS